MQYQLLLHRCYLHRHTITDSKILAHFTLIGKYKVKGGNNAQSKFHLVHVGISSSKDYVCYENLEYIGVRLSYSAIFIGFEGKYIFWKGKVQEVCSYSQHATPDTIDKQL